MITVEQMEKIAELFPDIQGMTDAVNEKVVGKAEQALINHMEERVIDLTKYIHELIASNGVNNDNSHEIIKHQYMRYELSGSLELYRAAEKDESDIAAMKEAMAEGGSAPFEEVRQELGLSDPKKEAMPQQIMEGEKGGYNPSDPYTAQENATQTFVPKED